MSEKLLLELPMCGGAVRHPAAAPSKTCQQHARQALEALQNIYDDVFELVTAEPRSETNMEKILQEFRIIETDDGFRIEIRGDKEQLREFVLSLAPRRGWGAGRLHKHGRGHHEHHGHHHHDDEHGHGHHGHGRGRMRGWGPPPWAWEWDDEDEHPRRKRKMHEDAPVEDDASGDTV